MEELDRAQRVLEERRRAARMKLEKQFDMVNTKGMTERMTKEGCVVVPKLLEGFCKIVKDRILSVHRPKFLGWYKQGWRASDFFYNTPGQPEVDINPSLRFIHTILSPLLCGLLGSIIGSPVKVVQANVCHYSTKTNTCLENHFDGCPFSAIVHVYATDTKTSGLYIQREGVFYKVPTPNTGDLVLISGDKFLHRSCRIEGENERLVIVFFLEYSNPKDSKKAAEEVIQSSTNPTSNTKAIVRGESKKQTAKPPEVSTENPTRKACSPQTSLQRGEKERRLSHLQASVRRGKREGYVLQDEDKIQTHTKEDFRIERDTERARRRRRKLRRLNRGSASATGESRSEVSSTSGPVISDSVKISRLGQQ
ncbi:hypothetical protein AAMO2058_000660600 [Amorphochlora amoebiformis]|mmetsp:Transcript_18126/g.28875  ORF Transcript_18126/g.28875 Transcript_18126/m.28875 type:complete len:366 (-) Transcript_18126:135-1232(-)